MNKKLVILFALAFVVRILLINVAFHGDLNNNISWGNMALKGLNGFYERTGFQYSIPNQPPLYILLFAVTSFLYQTVSNLTWYLNNNVGVFPSSFVWFWQNNGMLILVKLPPILCDLGIGFVIYKFFEKKNRELGIKLAALWLFNPITFYNSSIWGQTDAIVNLLGLSAIYFLVNKKLVKSVLFLTLSLLFKGSLLLFMPILLVYALWQKYDLSVWVRAVLVAGIASVAVCVLFHPSIDLPIWVVNLYTKQILPGEVGDLSANAFNFWYLVNPGKVLDSVLYFGLPARIWGYLTILIATIVILVKLQKQKTEKRLLFALAIVALTSFLFMTRIHERYLYPFFPIATLLVGLLPEFIVPYVILAFTFLINMYNLFWAPGIPVVENILKTTSVPSFLAVVNLLVFLSVGIWFFKLKKQSKV